MLLEVDVDRSRGLVALPVAVLLGGGDQVHLELAGDEGPSNQIGLIVNVPAIKMRTPVVSRK